MDKHLLNDPTKVLVKQALTKNVFHELCLSINSPRSLTAWVLFREGEFQQLVDLEVDPNMLQYDGRADCFKLDYLVSSIFKKYQDFNLGLDKEALAFEKWLAAEALCKATNDKFRSFWSGNASAFSEPVQRGIHLAKQKIKSILGEFDVDLVRDNCRFGPGSDLSTRGGKSASYDKFCRQGSVTPWVLDLFFDVFSEHKVEDFVNEAQLVDSNRLSFVPKNAKIDRAICVEPRWNIFMQLGIGGLITKRLLSVGQDARRQDRNQLAASRAYGHSLATIDLSSASDTVSKNLIIELLSFCDEAWMDAIFKARSPATIYRGQKFKLEKVSSMGNGYTFPLETLVFYSLAYAACSMSGCRENQIRVYGDDIIIPRHAYDQLENLLVELGFILNSKKSFKSGNFFESCGHDYFQGVNVRPFFIKKEVSNAEAAIRLCNQILEYSKKNLYDSYADSKFLATWTVCFSAIPKAVRLLGPPEAGQGVIHASFDACQPKRVQHGWEGYRITSYVFTPNQRVAYGYTGHLYSKLSADINTGNRVSRRDDGRWRRKNVYVPKYTDICWV